MTSIEHGFHWSRVLFAPNDKTSEDESGQTGDENFQHIEEDRRTLHSVGLAVQSLGKGRKRINLPTEEIAAEYRNSVPVTELARRHNVSTATIYRRLYEVGLPTQDVSDKTSTNSSVQSEAENPQQTPLSGSRELTWGERLSKDGFWVLDYLHGIGYTKHLRELAQREGVDFDAGLEELRQQGLLDEGNPQYPTVKLP